MAAALALLRCSAASASGASAARSSLRLTAAGRPGLLAAGSSRGYHEIVVDHFNNPRNVGSLDKNDENVGTALVGKASCGDVIKLQIKVGDDGVIQDAKFKTFGCGSAIASSSLATEMIIGKPMEEAETIQNTDLSSFLKLPPVKIHCSVLAEEAIKTAIEDYKTKKASRTAAASGQDA
eukprot:TRINITY_DN19783_c0_g1_i1.p1 TRINITY_DN19783_c0_g1~~TRINITY_DN19783_c0_g1_i1.p1  ORF type:complete len:179 (-),score=61.34 TRINITY_DN19783_c0_g1_i1:179-715(-)